MKGPRNLLQAGGGGFSPCFCFSAWVIFFFFRPRNEVVDLPLGLLGFMFVSRFLESKSPSFFLGGEVVEGVV